MCMDGHACVTADLTNSQLRIRISRIMLCLFARSRSLLAIRCNSTALVLISLLNMLRVHRHRSVLAYGSDVALSPSLLVMLSSTIPTTSSSSLSSASFAFLSTSRHDRKCFRQDIVAAVVVSLDNEIHWRDGLGITSVRERSTIGRLWRMSVQWLLLGWWDCDHVDELNSENLFDHPYGLCAQF